MKIYQITILLASMMFTSQSVIANSDTSNLSKPVLPGTGTTESVFMTTQFPKPHIWINMMPVIGEPRETPSVDVYMTLTNKTYQSIVYTFPTSQTFDIYILDSFGNVVSKWSQNMFFLQIITNITIPSGGSKTFGGKVKLASSDGQILNPGDYVVLIKLVNINNSSGPVISVASDSLSPGTVSHNPSSQMPLRIDWAY